MYIRLCNKSIKLWARAMKKKKNLRPSCNVHLHRDDGKDGIKKRLYYFPFLRHYCDITLAWRRLKSPTLRLFVQQIVETEYKETSNSVSHRASNAESISKSWRHPALKAVTKLTWYISIIHPITVCWIDPPTAVWAHFGVIAKITYSYRNVVDVIYSMGPCLVNHSEALVSRPQLQCLQKEVSERHLAIDLFYVHSVLKSILKWETIKFWDLVRLILETLR